MGLPHQFYESMKGFPWQRNLVLVNVAAHLVIPTTESKGGG